VPTSRVVEILNERHGYNLPVDETVAHKEGLFLEMSVEIAAIEPVVSLAREYHGRKPLAVASGGHHRIVLGRLDALQRQCRAVTISTVVTAEDITHPKPAPEALELALRHLSLSPVEAVYVGDAHADFEMSRAAGVSFVGVSSEFANLMEDHPEYDVHPIATLPRVIELIK